MTGAKVLHDPVTLLTPTRASHQLSLIQVLLHPVSKYYASEQWRQRVSNTADHTL